MRIVDIITKPEDDYGYRDFIKSSVSPICITEITKVDNDTFRARFISLQRKFQTNKVQVVEFSIIIYDLDYLFIGITGIKNNIIQTALNINDTDQVEIKAVYYPKVNSTDNMERVFGFNIRKLSNKDEPSDGLTFRSSTDEEKLRKELLDLDVPNVIAHNLLKEKNK